MNLRLKIRPRFVKTDNDGLRPFQRETLHAICDKNIKIVEVEAPVGAGKSYILKEVVKCWDGPIILTYPTKILMESQAKSLKREFPESILWPEDKVDICGCGNSIPTIFYYSSDTLIQFLKQQNKDYRLDRGELLSEVLHQHFFASRCNILLTSPDVLHLLINLKSYRGSQRLISFFTGSLVVFDEFHLYVELKHFSRLLNNLFESGINKVVLLSATPVISKDLHEIFEKYKIKKIDFSESIGKERDDIFNYPLDLEFVNCRYTKKDELLKILREYIPSLPKPLAIIVDSVFRLRHILPLLKHEFGSHFKILEYSGFSKDDIVLNENTIIMGTASIEVGINMIFKSLIVEASYWISTIQRIGRVGRFSEGTVIVLTTKNMLPYVKDKKSLSRDELENNVLKASLKDIRMTYVCGEMFRGDSYPFILYDIDTDKIYTYSESIFAMFEPVKRIDDWQLLDIERKKTILEEYVKTEEEISDLLIRDKLFPFWGVVEGRLRDNYERITIHADEDGLTILCSDSGTRFDFEGRR